MNADAEREKSPEATATRMVNIFRPILSEFGFNDLSWEYDRKRNFMELNFTGSGGKHGVQIECNLKNETCKPHYCRAQGQWSVCTEGKFKSVAFLALGLGEWVKETCVYC